MKSEKEQIRMFGHFLRLSKGVEHPIRRNSRIHSGSHINKFRCDGLIPQSAAPTDYAVFGDKSSFIPLQILYVFLFQGNGIPEQYVL